MIKRVCPSSPSPPILFLSPLSFFQKSDGTISSATIADRILSLPSHRLSSLTQMGQAGWESVWGTGHIAVIVKMCLRDSQKRQALQTGPK